METQIYSFWKGLKKAAIGALLFGLPVIVQATPEAWKNITLGAILALVANYVKVKWSAAYGE